MAQTATYSPTNVNDIMAKVLKADVICWATPTMKSKMVATKRKIVIP